MLGELAARPDPSRDPMSVFPSLLALVTLRWLVIDVIAHTADAGGPLNRMLPR
jgi:hypothetical protein